MAEKPKPKAKPKQKTKFRDKKQSGRFIEAARELGAEKTGDRFNQAFDRIVPPKRSSSDRP